MRKLLLFVGLILILLPAATQASTSANPTASTIYALVGTSTPVESSAVIEKEITSLSPKAGAFVAPVLSAVDSARTWTANFLQGQIVGAAPKLPGNDFLVPSNAKSFSATSQFDWHRALSTIVGVLWTLYFYILIILRFLIAKALICYPLIVVAFFYILYRLGRYISRPRWRRRR